MKEQLEKLMKLQHDIQSRINVLAKKNGIEIDSNVVKMDAIQKDEFEKMKAELFEVQKKIAESKQTIDEEKAQEKAFNFGQWLLKAKFNDPELVKEHMKTVMSEGTNAQGGYTVPTGQSAQIIGFLNDFSVLVNRMTKLPHGRMDGFTKNLPAWLTDLTPYWVDEAGEKTVSKPTFTQYQSILKKLCAIVTLTDEYLADNIVNITTQISKLVAENFAIELERVALVGTTVGGDPFNGVYYAVTAANQHVNQAGANLHYNDLVAAFTNVNILQRYLMKAEWWMSRTAYGIIMKMSDNNERPLWNLGNPLESPFGIIFGKKINISDQIPNTLGDNSDHTAIIYGDPKFIINGFKAGKNAISVKVSQDGVISPSGSITENLFTQDETAYRFVKRDSIVVIPDAFHVIDEVR